MQSGEVRSLKYCIYKTFRADGVKGFFLGMSSPIASVPLANSLVFGAYAHANSFCPFASNFWKGIFSGSYAGLISSIVVCPVELIKIKMQIQSKDKALGSGFKYTGVTDCIVKTFKDEGVKGFYKGGVSTIYREIPGYAAQFAFFEGCKELGHYVYDTEQLPMHFLFISGMLSGLNAWIWSYPQDLIKTIIQIGNQKKKTWDGGFNSIAKEIWQKNGFLGFFKGFSPVLVRSTLPNGFGFLTYELAIEHLQKMDLRE